MSQRALFFKGKWEFGVLCHGNELSQLSRGECDTAKYERSASAVGAEGPGIDKSANMSSGSSNLSESTFSAPYPTHEEIARLRKKKQKEEEEDGTYYERRIHKVCRLRRLALRNFFTSPPLQAEGMLRRGANATSPILNYAPFRAVIHTNWKCAVARPSEAGQVQTLRGSFNHLVARRNKGTLFHGAWSR
jgi:hypothetical protein